MKKSFKSNRSIIFSLSLCFLSCGIAHHSLGDNTYSIHVKIIAIRCVNEIEENLIPIRQANSDDERKGLLDKMLHRFQKPDLSRIDITLSGQFLPEKMTKKTNKNGDVVFEGVPHGYYEVVAVKEVLDNGKPATAIARTCLKRGKRSAFLELSTDWVTLKGRVVTSDGTHVEDAIICLEPLFTGQDSSEQYANYPSQKTSTGTNGLYELQYVKPLSVDMATGYLINSNATERSQRFFYALISASKSNTNAYVPHQLQIPLISQDILNMAMRRISLKGQAFQDNLQKPYLPESKDNVIFLPDIIIHDPTQKPATNETPKTKQ